MSCSTIASGNSFATARARIKGQRARSGPRGCKSASSEPRSAESAQQSRRRPGVTTPGATPTPISRRQRSQSRWTRHGRKGAGRDGALREGSKRSAQRGLGPGNRLQDIRELRQGQQHTCDLAANRQSLPQRRGCRPRRRTPAGELRHRKTLEGGMRMGDNGNTDEGSEAPDHAQHREGVCLVWCCYLSFLRLAAFV